MNATCSFPGCGRPARAKGLCVGHIWQRDHGGVLTPIRQREPGRVVLSLRVEPEVKAAVAKDPDGARAVLRRWAKRLLVAALLLGAVSARGEWTARDTTLELAGATLHLIDWSQTVNIANSGPEVYTLQINGTRMAFQRGARLYEANPILGEHPSSGAVTAYFAATLAAHAAIAYMLPRPYRTVWQGLWIGVELGCVVHNFSTGVRLDFP